MTIDAIDYEGSDLLRPIIIGAGFDSLTGELKSPCVDGKERFADVRSGRSRYKGQIAEKTEDVLQESSMSVSAAFGYGIYSGNASYDRSTRRHTTTGSIEAIIRRTYVQRPNLIGGDGNVPYRADVKRQYVDKKDLIGFRERCGDMFVYAVSRGAAYEARISIKTLNDDSEEQVRQALSFAMKGVNAQGSLSAESQQRLRTILTSRDVTWDHMYIGDNVSQRRTNPSCSDAPDKIPTGSSIDDAMKFAETLDCRAVPVVKQGREVFALRQDGKIEGKVIESVTDWEPAEAVVWYLRSYPVGQFEDVPARDVMDALLRLYLRRAGLRDMREKGYEVYGPYESRATDTAITELTRVIDEMKDRYKELVAAHEKRETARAAELRTKLSQSLPARVLPPPHRAKVYAPDLTQPMTMRLGYFDDAFPRRFELRGNASLSPNADPKGWLCPETRCPGPILIEFKDRNGAIAFRREFSGGTTERGPFDVPSNTVGYLTVPDAADGYWNNKWDPPGSGIFVYEKRD